MSKAAKTDDEEYHIRSPLTDQDLSMCASLLHRAVRFGQSAQLLQRVNDWVKIRPDLRPNVVGAQVIVDASMSTMTDAAKRRMDADETSQASNPWELLNANEPTGSTMTPERLAVSPKGYEAGKVNLFPAANVTDRLVPLPEGISTVEKWGQTICRMDKVKAESLTYDQMIMTARTNSKKGEDMRQYLQFILSKYGTGGKVPSKIAKAVDFAMYLEKVKWKKPDFEALAEKYGFSRELRD